MMGRIEPRRITISFFAGKEIYDVKDRRFFKVPEVDYKPQGTAKAWRCKAGPSKGTADLCNGDAASPRLEKAEQGGTELWRFSHTHRGGVNGQEADDGSRKERKREERPDEGN
jgi:hypothetical protein